MDPMDSETQPADDLADLEAEYSNPPPAPKEPKTFKWNVQVIDNDGKIESKMLSYKDVCKLQNCKVIVHFDEDCNQPIGDSGGLLGSWLGLLSNDVNLLPINYSDWRLVDPHIKDKAWEVIRTHFWFDDPMFRERYVMSALGARCKDVKLRLWKEYKRGTPSETRQNRPENVCEDHWNQFVHMRFSEKWKKMQAQNTRSQRENKMPHGCGRMSFPRKRNEIKIKTGKTPCRAEFFIESRKRSDGSFISEEAKTRAEELTRLLSQNPQVPNNVIASLDDEYAQVFGPERPGRVRCVGRGVTPSKLAKQSTANIPENSEKVIQLEENVARLTEQVTCMNTFIRQILGTSTPEQASTWATAFASLPNSVFANMFTTPPAFANPPAFTTPPAFANPTFTNMSNFNIPPAFAPVLNQPTPNHEVMGDRINGNLRG